MALPRNPIIWIDLETTGLDIFNDTILEVAVVITDNLGKNEVDSHGLQLVVKTDEAVLNSMHHECIKMHGPSGLIDACLASSHTRADVVDQVMKYIKKWVPSPRVAMLGGSSVHFDRAFLNREMPEITAYLKYQQLDVTSIMIATRALYNGVGQPERTGATKHRAMDDIRDTIRYYRYNLETFFRPPQEFIKARSIARAQTMPNIRPSGSSTKNGPATEKHEPGGVVRRVSNGARNTKPYDTPQPKQDLDKPVLNDELQGSKAGLNGT